jgi:putative FmdB family regulatory protein
VPTYQYACTDCGDKSEVVQRFTDDPLTVCSACGGKLRKVFSPVGIVFKGSGFYRTDSRSGASTVPAGSANGSGSSSESSSGSDSSNGSSGSKGDSGSKSGDSGSKGGDSGSKSKSADSGSSGRSAGSSDKKSSSTAPAAASS